MASFCRQSDQISGPMTDFWDCIQLDLRIQRLGLGNISPITKLALKPGGLITDIGCQAPAQIDS